METRVKNKFTSEGKCWTSCCELLSTGRGFPAPHGPPLSRRAGVADLETVLPGKDAGGTGICGRHKTE